MDLKLLKNISKYFYRNNEKWEMVANNAIEGLPIDVNIYSHPTIKNKNSEYVNSTLTIYNYEEDVIELCIQFWIECNIIDEIIKNITYVIEEWKFELSQLDYEDEDSYEEEVEINQKYYGEVMISLSSMSKNVYLDDTYLTSYL